MHGVSMVVAVARVAAAAALLACGGCSSPAVVDAPRDAGADAVVLDAAPAADAAPEATSDAAVACSVTAPTACPTPAPTFADVTAVLTARCAECHSGAAGGPWPLDTYEHVADWQNEIRASLVDCSMPPADASAPIRDDERNVILSWIKCGTPR